MQMFIQKYYFSIYNINWFSNIKEGTYEDEKGHYHFIICSGSIYITCSMFRNTRENSGERRVKLTDQQLMADLWYQTAGETKALYYQGYNIGQLKLDAALAKGTEKKPAIVLDLDETVLDNSPHQAMSVKQEKAIRINGMIGLIRLKLKPSQVQLIS